MQNTSDMIELWMDEWQSLLRLPLLSLDHCHLIIIHHLALNAGFEMGVNKYESFFDQHIHGLSP